MESPYRSPFKNRLNTLPRLPWVAILPGYGLYSMFFLGWLHFAYLFNPNLVGSGLPYFLSTRQKMKLCIS